MRAATDAHLYLLLEIASQVPPDRRAGARADLEASVFVYERLGVISAAEANRWRERAVNPVGCSGRGTPSPPLSADAITAGRRYLTALLERISAPGPAADEFGQALDTLLAVGALDDAERARWRLALHHATGAPIGPPDSLEQAFLTLRRGTPSSLENRPGYVVAPAATGAARPPPARPRAAEIGGVVLGAPERRQGLAIVALLHHEDAVRLYFHHLGEAEDPNWPAFERLERRREATHALTPPALSDNAGTTYTPVDDRPASATGPGGSPDTPVRMVSHGSWLYTPAASQDVSCFTVQLGQDRWLLQSAT